jgi:hypothetical protein
MPKHSDRRATQQWAKSGPPEGLPLEALRTALRRLSGFPTRPARRSLPKGLQWQSRCANVVDFGSKINPPPGSLSRSSRTNRRCR